VSVNFNKDDLVEDGCQTEHTESRLSLVKNVVVADAIKIGLKNKNYDQR